MSAPADPSPPPFDEDAVHGARTPTEATRRWWRRSRGGGAEAAEVAVAPDDQQGEGIRTPLTRSRRIVVASRKGGVGKTTTALLLGHAFAAHRADRAVVIDGDPDGGTLGHRVERGHARHLGDLLDHMRDLHGYTAIREHTVHTPTGLEVLTTSPDPTATRSYHDAEYLRVIAKLTGAYGVIITDSGTGVLDNVTAGLLEAADQLVLVARPGVDEAWAAAATLDWLEEQGSRQMVADAVVCLNVAWPDQQLDLTPIEAHFAARCRSVVTIPHDAHLELGGVVDPVRLAPATQAAVLDLAAAVGRGFTLDSARDARREAQRAGGDWHAQGDLGAP